VILNDGDHPVCGGVNRQRHNLTIRPRPCETRPHRKRIKPLAEAVRDMPEHRPDRRGIGGIAKLITGIKRKPPLEIAIVAAFFLQKGVLLDRRSNASCASMGLSLWSKAAGDTATRHKVMATSVARDCSGVQALIRVIDRILQLPVLLF